jgi:hypothetical protein
VIRDDGGRRFGPHLFYTLSKRHNMFWGAAEVLDELRTAHDILPFE